MRSGSTTRCGTGWPPSWLPSIRCCATTSAATAARLIHEWGRGPVVFVGLSMGGMVGQGLAVRDPNLLRGLVIANSVARYPPEARSNWSQRIAAVEAGGMASIADSVLERYFHPGFRADLDHADSIAAFRRKVLSTDPDGYVACCHAVAGVDWLEQLNSVRCPTLVIAGALDIGALPAMSAAIVERISGAKLVVLEAASHLSVVEQPVQFGRLLQDFLAGLERPPERNQVE